MAVLSLSQDLLRIGLDGRFERAKLLRLRDQLGVAPNSAAEQPQLTQRGVC